MIKVYCDRCGALVAETQKPENILMYFIPAKFDPETGIVDGRDGVHFCQRCKREHAEWFERGKPK